MTTPQSATTPVERLRIGANGSVAIGMLPSTEVSFAVSGTGQFNTALTAIPPQTSASDQAQFNILTNYNTSKVLGQPGTLGWSWVARNNAYNFPTEQNDLFLYYWNGSAWRHSIGVDSVTGNVGIGGSSDSALQVSGTIRAHQYCDYAGNNCSSAPSGGVATNDRIVSGTTSMIVNNNTSATISTNGVQRLIVGTNGNIGMGVQPVTGYGLAVSGTTAFYGDIMHTGDIYGTSDARLKTDVSNLSSSMDTLMGLRPVSFEFRNRPGHLEYGFIAQEVQKLYPNLVHTAKDASRTLSVNYNGFIAPVVQGLKEVNTDVQQLKQENATLRSELEALRAEVRALAKQKSAN
jgi:hypothetical protein